MLPNKTVIDKIVEGYAIATPVSFQDGAQEPKTEIDKIHVDATVDEDTVGNDIGRNASDPVHLLDKDVITVGFRL
ncbi:uncharacterized protein A4U43_C07F29990 [Asparagus officinalis]|uniref:Uncharacterized protein n=1 Tax=Asparagus officinalis TaxID=4686 RepID=A0A5P1EG28_ASPOF|nr:uncharacterized protein A4U43_C07F29990 [Asparagus officinalis]